MRWAGSLRQPLHDPEDDCVKHRQIVDAIGAVVSSGGTSAMVMIAVGFGEREPFGVACVDQERDAQRVAVRARRGAGLGVDADDDHTRGHDDRRRLGVAHATGADVERGEHVDRRAPGRGRIGLVTMTRIARSGWHRVVETRPATRRGARRVTKPPRTPRPARTAGDRGALDDAVRQFRAVHVAVVDIGGAHLGAEREVTAGDDRVHDRPEVGGAPVDRGEIGRDDDGRQQGDGAAPPTARGRGGERRTMEVPSTRAIREVGEGAAARDGSGGLRGGAGRGLVGLLRLWLLGVLRVGLSVRETCLGFFGV